MIYRFESFELDTAQVELRDTHAAIPIEPQVFALLKFLIEQRERVVSKDELIKCIWAGRVVSDSAVASRIKSARQALGDNGRAQRFIRTLHGAGFRFVAAVAVAPAVDIAMKMKPALNAPERERSSRPTLAVLPFRLLGDAGPHFVVADALPQDLITELSRLHWLFVIARASSFHFRGAEAALDRVSAALNVRYCLSGMIEIFNRAMTVSVELSDTRDRGVVWSERFEAPIDATHEVRAEIVRAVIGALELQIPLNEARRAQLKAPQHLDAWSAYHLGLQHMYRFNRTDNTAAADFFERAVALEPGFARAYAGLSFTHFQSAFLHYDDVPTATRLAQHCAEQCLERDPVDPFGNFAMGRTFWLRADLEGSLPWLERANTLNPNYAQAKYSRAWVDALLGAGAQSQTNADEALALSPLDPLRYGMLGVRAFSHIVRNEPAQAADWAERAARSPGAHALIEMIAVVAHGLNADDARARAWAESARARASGFTEREFLHAFPFRDPAICRMVIEMLQKYGF